MILNSFVLIGTILSHDAVFSTVEFNTNPATNGGPSIAVLPNTAIPCELKVGKKIYHFGITSNASTMRFSLDLNGIV